METLLLMIYFVCCAAIGGIVGWVVTTLILNSRK